MDWNNANMYADIACLYTFPRPPTTGRGFSSRDAPAGIKVGIYRVTQIKF